MRLPSFIIIGAQKGASTWLQNCLAFHPKVGIILGENPFFEHPDYDESKLEEFANLFQEFPEDAVLGFKRPTYLFKPESPQLITKHIPDAKLIAILRNPVDRAIAAYFWYMYTGFLPIRDVETGMRKLLDGEYEQSYPRSKEIIEAGNYGKQLEHYYKYVQPENLLVFTLEDIKEDAERVWSRSLEFIGAPYEPSEHLSTRFNEGAYSLARIRLHRISNSIRYQYNEDRTRMYTKKDLSGFQKWILRKINDFDMSVLKRFVNDSKPKVSQELRQKLIDIYRDDVMKLEKLLNRDLRNWLEQK